VYHRVRPKRLLSLWYVWHKPCTYLVLTLTPSPNGPKRALTQPKSPRCSFGCVQNNFQAPRSAETMHLSCVKISIVFKWTETSLHLSLDTLKYHQVRPKWLLSLWYVWRKPCTYPALTLTPPPNDWNEIWHDPYHLGVPSGASKNDFWAYGMFSTTMRLSCVKISLSPNRLKRAFTWVSSPLSTIGCVQNDLWAYGTFGANHAPILHWH
jgi:hypothetical protein